MTRFEDRLPPTATRPTTRSSGPVQLRRAAGRLRPAMRWAKGQGLLLIVLLLAAAPIAYVGFREFDIDDPATGGDTGDSAVYARMALTGKIDDVPKPYRYRVVVPLVAHLWLRLTGDGAGPADVQATFAVLNLLGLAVAAWAVCNYLRAFGFSAHEGVTGALLFLSTWPILRFGGVVLTDSWSHAVLAGAAYAIVARRHWLLLATVTVGMFVRETTVFAALVVLVVPAPRPTRLGQLACFAPGVVGYLLFRFVLSPTSDGYAYTADRIGRQLAGVVTSSGLSGAVRELALTFGAMGLLLVVGLVRDRKGGTLPRRLFWLIPVALAIPFLVASNLARVWFLAFPAAIPLALLGLRAVLSSTGPAGPRGDRPSCGDRLDGASPATGRVPTVAAPVSRVSYSRTTQTSAGPCGVSCSCRGSKRW